MEPAEMEELLVNVKLGLQAFTDVVEMPMVGDGEMINVLEVLAGQLWLLKAEKLTVYKPGAE